MAQPHDDALKPSPANGKDVAEGSDVAEHNPQTSIDSIDDSSINPLSADSCLGSAQIQGGSTPECVQYNVLGDSFSLSMIGSAHLLGTVGTLSNNSNNNDVGAAIAPVTGDVAQPVTAVSDTLADAVPVVEMTEPVLTTTAAAVSAPTSDVTSDVSIRSTPAMASDAVADAAPVDEAAGDVIALNDAPPPPENAVHTGTEYTDYGVSLSSDVAVPPQDTGSSAGAASASDTAPPPPETVDTNQPTEPELAVL